MSEEKRSIEVEVEVPGTPDEVWQAIATGPGITAWFVPTEVDERVGGQIRFQLPIGVESIGHVTTWEPPRRLVYEARDWMPGAPPLATELVVETRAGGACVVRLVTSLFSSADDWDDQLDSMKAGWVPFFRLLALYLARFAGQRCAPIQAHGVSGETQARTWAALAEALRLGREAGMEFRSMPGAPPLAGVIDRIASSDKLHEVVALLSEPVPGTALIAVHQWGGDVHASLSIYLFGDEARSVAERDRPAWAAWMARLFGPGNAASGSGSA